MKKQNKKGFTLVELVIVIAVIAILAGVMIGTFSSVVKNANKSSDLQEVKTSVDEKYYNYIAESNGEVPNCFEWTVESEVVTFVDFATMDMPNKTFSETDAKTVLDADTTIDVKGTYYIKVVDGANAGDDETLGTVEDTLPTTAGTYLVVTSTYDATDKNTVKSMYLLTVKVEGSKATYHSTYLEVVGRKKTTVTLSFDGTNYVVANAKD